MIASKFDIIICTKLRPVFLHYFWYYTEYFLLEILYFYLVK